MWAALESELTGAVDRLWPSVVRIDRRGASPPEADAPVPVEGSGSGLVWDTDGIVVTNDHVVRAASRLEVTLANGETVDGRVLGRDPLTDLAALRVSARGLSPAPRGDSASLRVGQLALAVGYSLGLPGGPTVSIGVVSALNRPIPGTDFVLEGLIQTDAAINPGNSGGPLADARGSVIGLNSSIVAFAQGVGFAVPVGTVDRVVRALRRSGRVIRPWLGIQGVGVDEQVARRLGLSRRRGVWIGKVAPGSPAEAAGLRKGDVLTRVGANGLRGFHDLAAALAELPVGGSIDVAADRSGRTVRTVLRLEEARTGDPRARRS